MAHPTPDTPSFSFARRWSLGVSTVIAVAALLGLTVMINYLAARHFRRIDWSGSRQTQLSARTLQVLRSLTNTVRVTVYFDQRENVLYAQVMDLLKQYKVLSPRVELTAVDYEREPGAAKAVKARYNLTRVTDKDLVIFESGGRTRVVSGGDLSEYDVSGLLQQKTNEVRRTHFKGELAFTSAIYSVTAGRTPKVYFLQGHNEHPPDRPDQSTSYSQLAALFRTENNLACEKLSLVGDTEVPADCSLLVIGGPFDPIPKPELDKIQHYLEQGGRAFILFNYYSVAKGMRTGLERLLANWDIEVGQNLVVDERRSLSHGQNVVPADLGNHPIVRPLQDTGLLLTLPRSITHAKTAARADAAKVEELLTTSAGAVTYTEFKNRLPQPNPALDKHGAVSLMVAVEKGTVPGVSAERGATRLVVLGDSLFLQDDGIDALANRDFAAQCVNWLLDQQVLLSGLAPRPVKEYKLIMTQGQMAAVRSLLLVVFPAGILAIGAVVSWRRRS